MSEPLDQSRTPPGGAPAPLEAALAGARGLFSPTQRLLITAAAIGVTLLFMRLASGIIVPVLLALVITMAVSPLLNLMIRHRVPPILAWLACVILTTAVVVCVFVLGGIGVARLIGELRQYTAALGVRLDEAADGLKDAGIDVSGLTQGDALLSPQRIIQLGIDLLQTARRVIGGVALTLLIVYFMLAEATTLQLKFAMTPPNVSPTLQRLELFTRDMRSFVQAATILGIINGTAAGIFLWLLGIDFPVMWGVFAFLMTFIPTLGFFVAVFPPAFLALLSSGWQEAVLVLIGYLVIWAVTASMRSGRFVGGRLNLSPLTILLSIILWGWVLGLMGGLLAVPMTLLVRRLFVEAYDESRWITDLLGRPGRMGQDAARPPTLE
jgi:predicted PurR-regulated permease PerM